ncbi:polyhydroxyalkanoate depolymerase [Burkholderia ubonensis]|uniref:polyhydroxyalkanoate depolymerase n=1 Tax=Burkholderia ubonensis TaxID=101571 RepID=UPI000F5729EA|nr:polyhydroxyalkanoate depolymerase [Burkholderia ubonensis]RQP27044.1 polyhydroxyalkanoate depolymerase [Burkholderia ubonensis]RQP28633.1 polyhydroxyalkanoate depolymerase [Burkholderia ubonensis]RQP29532.1 polyhydroxyalkanoate depolymerase [Burkholderia ubonensis]RQP45995.1 polyhydroxyalkanoate depolymerase [Burkholderia ubonensis]RQP48801.1 polyhydroxyalkanoate depolymerase [Burkholderia ubonensis]
MWYDLVEQQRQWLRAWHAAARNARDAWPAATLAHAASSWYTDLFEPLLGLPADPPPFAIGSIVHDGRRVEVEERIVARTPFCDLRHFARAGARRTVLLCAPLVGHAAAMMRDTVEGLLADGDVCITDWIDACDVSTDAGRFGLDEYVAILDGFIDALACAGRPLHIVAVCQATVPALGALALRARRTCPQPASLTLIGGPLDARLHPSALGVAAQSHSLDWCRHHLIDVVPTGFAGHGRLVFPAYLQRAEIAILYPHRYLALTDRYTQAMSRSDAEALADARRELRAYAALLDMPAEYFLDTVDIVFQRASLANGIWQVDGKLVEPAELRGVILLTIEGTCDAVTGAGQTHAALQMCSGLASHERRRLDVDGCDHYGLFTGERWRDDVHPVLQTVFVQAESGQARRYAAPHRSRVAAG